MKKAMSMVALYAALQSGTVFAWQPCMPFCDSGCGGAAISRWGSSFSSAAGNVEGANNKVGESIEQVSGTVANVGADISQTMTDTNFEILKSISASAGIVELAHVKSVKQKQEITDHTLSTLATISKELLVSQELGVIRRTFGDTSQPASGDLFVNTGSALKVGLVKGAKLADLKTDNFSSYLQDYSDVDGSAHASNILNEGSTWEDIVLLFKDGITLAETQILEKYLTYLVEPSPSAPGADSDSRTLVEHKRRTAMLVYLFGLLQESFSLSERTVSSSLASHYYSSDTIGNVSVREHFSALTEGRLHSDEWYLNMKLMNTAGLLRERAYLRAEELALNFLISRMRESSNNLLALGVADEMYDAGVK